MVTLGSAGLYVIFASAEEIKYRIKSHWPINAGYRRPHVTYTTRHSVLKRSVQTGFEFQSVDNWLQWEPQLAHFI